MRTVPPDHVFRRLVVVRDELLADLANAPRLSELARQAGMSRFHFLRRWKDAFGVTPHEDLTRLRIARAKALLTADAASVTEVCLEVGFSSLSSFSTLFAERAGCPPSAWRRRVYRLGALAEPSALLIPHCYLVRIRSPARSS